IDNIQSSWVKLGEEACRAVLAGGVNDLGGTLMEETISRMAGAANGSYKTISDLESLVAPLGRPVVQRTTTYGRPTPARVAAPSQGRVHDRRGCRGHRVGDAETHGQQRKEEEPVGGRLAHRGRGQQPGRAGDQSDDHDPAGSEPGGVPAAQGRNSGRDTRLRK